MNITLLPFNDIETMPYPKKKKIFCIHVWRSESIKGLQKTQFIWLGLCVFVCIWCFSHYENQKHSNHSFGMFCSLSVCHFFFFLYITIGLDGRFVSLVIRNSITYHLIFTFVKRLFLFLYVIFVCCVGLVCNSMTWTTTDMNWLKKLTRQVFILHFFPRLLLTYWTYTCTIHPLLIAIP